ncbi:hypothetical protein [Streptomyces sp. G45]|uniref:hypothetical protein n=1 Tax=Streptomyces sp. G45 TaxID=3406627 RepID=UPI003C206FE1
MADDTWGPGYRPDDPAADAAEHLAAALGTAAWPVASAEAAVLLGGDSAAADRVRAWAADAQRHEGADLDAFLLDAVPHWQHDIASALASAPERAAQARRFTAQVHALLAGPGAPDGTDTADTSDTGTAQFATASGHGTVNAVQNGNIYYQVLLGQTPRPRRMSRRKAATVTGLAASGAAAGGVTVARHAASEAAARAGAGDLPQGPLADAAPPPPPQPPHPPDPVAAGAAGHGGAGSASGTTAVVKTGASGFAKVVAGVTGGGVSVPVVATVVTVTIAVVATVSVVVTQNHERASCDAAVDGRSAPAALAEAARRTGRTSFRYSVTRGTHHVAGAADPRTRSARFTQRVGDGPHVAGTVDRGKVRLPTGTALPAGADRRLVRSDGAFADAVDPTAAARMLQAVSTAKRTGCAFSGRLARAQDSAVRPASAARGAPREPAAPSGSASTAFRARIDPQGRLVRLDVDAAPGPGGHAVSARYSDFGLRVTAATPSGSPSSAGPGGDTDAATRVNGEWTGGWSAGFASGGFTARLTVESDRVSGRLSVSETGCDLDGDLTGTLEGDRITFGTVDSAVPISFTGTLDGTTMSGTFSTACQSAKGSWKAQKSP